MATSLQILGAMALRRSRGCWRRLLLGSLVGSLPGALPAFGQSVAPIPPVLATSAAPLVLRGVTVIDVRSGRRLPNRIVVIAGTRIQALGRTDRVRVPRAARVVDARGKYLIPGLWDMHVHTMGYADATYPLFIANGVTGVRDAGSPVPLATLSAWKREIAAGTRVGPRLLVSGPALEGHKIPFRRKDLPDTVNVRTYPEPNERIYAYVPLVAVRRAVDSLKAAGADLLKIYQPPRAIRWALVAEAKRVGLRFGGHGSDDVWGEELSDSGTTFLDHGTWASPDVCGENAGESNPLAGFDGPRCAALVAKLRRNHTWVTTLGGFYRAERQLAWAYRYLPDSGAYLGVPEIAQQSYGDTVVLDSLARAHEPISGAAWERLRTQTATEDSSLSWAAPNGGPIADSLQKYGASLPVVIGTDVGGMNFSWCIPPAGFGVHEALMTLTRRRLPTGFASYVQPTLLAGLQTATLNPALALQATDSLGTVEAGKLADLVLLDADPLVDIWNTTKIRAVVANGRYYDRAALDGLLQAAHQAAVRSRTGSRSP